ncbi:hypothetical protein ACFL6P_02790 [Candidatus Latescibacterota bacterium]
MENVSYNLIFHGVFADGHDAETVRKNIADLFKVSDKKVERLFSGSAVTVKKNVDHATALKYQTAFKNAGALCSIEEVPPDTLQHEPTTPESTDVKKLSIPQNLKVVTPERTRRELRFSPLQVPSITSTGTDLNFSRADMKPVPLGDVELISVFSEEEKDEIVYRIVFFLKETKRPLMLNVDTIRFNQFPGVRKNTTMKSLRSFILYLVTTNPHIIIDRHTEEFLHGNQQNLIVIEPLDFITALGKSLEA